MPGLDSAGPHEGDVFAHHGGPERLRTGSQPANTFGLYRFGSAEDNATPCGITGTPHVTRSASTGSGRARPRRIGIDSAITSAESRAQVGDHPGDLGAPTDAHVAQRGHSAGRRGYPPHLPPHPPPQPPPPPPSPHEDPPQDEPPSPPAVAALPARCTEPEYPASNSPQGAGTEQRHRHCHRGRTVGLEGGTPGRLQVGQPLLLGRPAGRRPARVRRFTWSRAGAARSPRTGSWQRRPR